MKAIMISIKPKYVSDILNGIKTIEIRKTMPKCELPIDVYIYCTKDKDLLHKNIASIYWAEDTNFKAKNKKLGLKTQPYLNGKVVAKFTLKRVEEIVKLGSMVFKGFYTSNYMNEETLLKKSCLDYEQLDKYLKGEDGYAWHIENLEIFDRPKELNEFQIKVFPSRKDNLFTRYISKAPQSWGYVEVDE